MIESSSRLSPRHGESGETPRQLKTLEHGLEFVLWNSRWMVLPAVLASLFLAVCAFAMATKDVWRIAGKVVEYLGPSLPLDVRAAERVEIITMVVKTVDTYLIASILLIFGLGFYELFISRIQRHDEMKGIPRLMSVRSFDDLKDRMAKLILLVLVTEFFQYALRIEPRGAQELLFLAFAILLIGAALYLSSLTKVKDATVIGSGGSEPLDTDQNSKTNPVAPL